MSWQDSFKSHCVRTSFTLSLTRPMLEYLSAVADGVMWDRTAHGSAAAYPDNFISISRALLKRGLIERNPSAKRQLVESQEDDRFHEWSAHVLTPAGKHVVELLKLAGLFVEADAAINKKARQAQAKRTGKRAR